MITSFHSKSPNKTCLKHLQRRKKEVVYLIIFYKYNWMGSQFVGPPHTVCMIILINKIEQERFIALNSKNGMRDLYLETTRNIAQRKTKIMKKLRRDLSYFSFALPSCLLNH